MKTDYEMLYDAIKENTTTVSAQTEAIKANTEAIRLQNRLTQAYLKTLVALCKDQPENYPALTAAISEIQDLINPAPKKKEMDFNIKKLFDD